MKCVPCIICLKTVEVSDDKIVATVCETCLTDENIKKIGSSFTLRKLKEVLKKYKEKPIVNEFGELI